MNNETMKRILWWLCLFVAPLCLIVIELFHPAGFTLNPGMYEYLSIPEQHTHEHNALAYFGPEWWFTLHMIQTPLVCLVAVGLWLMVDGIDREQGIPAMVSGWIARAATFIFAIYYTVLDAIGGIGLGRTIQIAETLALTKEPSESACTSSGSSQCIALLLNKSWTDPWVGGVGSIISHTGSWAAFFAALFTAITLMLATKAPRLALVLLVAFGWELQLSHASFHGPIAFGLLVIAAFWIWWADKRRTS